MERWSATRVALDPERLRSPLDSIGVIAWLAAAPQDEEHHNEKAGVWGRIDASIMGRAISDRVEYLNAGLKDQKGLASLGTAAGVLITEALGVELITDPQMLALTAAMWGVISTMLAMANFSYRVSRKKKVHPLQENSEG